MNNQRPGLAIVSNVLTPYRAHLHRRIAEEIPEFTLHSLFTHARGLFNWSTTLGAGTNPVDFSQPGESTGASRIKSIPRHLVKARTIASHLGKQRVRAVILNGYDDATRVALTAYCRYLGIRVFIRADSNIRNRTRSGLTKHLKPWLLRRLLAQVDGVMPMGRLGQAYFAKFNVESHRMFLVPYEPDGAPFRQRHSALAAKLLNRHNLPPGRRLLYSGRLAPIKRVDLLINAFIRIASAHPQWTLIVAGDGPLRFQLQEQSPLPLRDRIRYIGFCDEQEIPALYSICDALALPSDSEPWGVVINEAAEAGLPIVASDVVGAAHELVINGTNGRIFPAGDVTALEDALCAIMTPEVNERYRRHMHATLADWKRRADPIAGIRSALKSVGLL